MINKVILIGHLGNDIDMKYTSSGKAVANLSLATNNSWNNKNTGQKEQMTQWHRVVVFGKLAEAIKPYLTKGSKLYVEGELRTRKWVDKNNIEHWTTEVVVSGFSSTLKLLDGKKEAITTPPVIDEADATAAANQEPVDDDMPF